MSREEIEKLGLEGKFDEDGFYILADGDFYDPLGYYFDKQGYDETGGHYDDDGYYVAAAIPESAPVRPQALTKEDILKLHPDGTFDEDGFLHLKDGDYFDPLGYYFNEDGLDCNGGRYDDEGFYIYGRPRDRSLQSCAREDILQEEGKYNELGFYNLASGGFYDPFGFKFDEQGFDAVGGYY